MLARLSLGCSVTFLLFSCTPTPAGNAESCDAGAVVLADGGAALQACESARAVLTADALECAAALSDAGGLLEGCRGALGATEGALTDAGTLLDGCRAELTGTGAALVDAGNLFSGCTAALSDAGAQLAACDLAATSCRGELADAGAALGVCAVQLTTTTDSLADAGALLTSCSGSLADAGVLLTSCSNALSDAGVLLTSCSATLATTTTALTDAGALLNLCSSALADAGAQLAATQAALDFAQGVGCGPIPPGQDLDFWFAPPDVSDLHNAPGGEPLYLHVISQGAASTVTVSMPANAAFVPLVVNLAAGETRRINLTAFKTSLETRPTNIIVNSGLRVQATTPISAAYEVANTNNGELFVLHGARGLGRTFTIPLNRHAPFFNEPSFAAPHQAFASFDIVATQNGTDVRIYSPVALDGHAAQRQFTVTLNAGQSYSAGYTGANWTLPSTHPVGAVVLANKPVAVTMKDDSVHNPAGGCYDLVGAQLVPDTALGTDFIVPKGALSSTGDEGVEMVAVQNDTEVYLDSGTTPVATLFAGEYFRIDLDYLSTSTDTSTFIHTTRPVSATRYTGFGCEMAVALVPPLQCAGSTRAVFTRTDAQTFWVELIAPTSAISSFSITGAGTAAISPASFVAVPGTAGSWSVGRVLFNTTQVPVDQAFVVTNSSAPFVLSTLSGGAASSARLGYFTPFASPRVAP